MPRQRLTAVPRLVPGLQRTLIQSVANIQPLQPRRGPARRRIAGEGSRAGGGRYRGQPPRIRDHAISHARKELSMLKSTQPPATAATTAEHPLATAGRHLVRYGLVVVIAWIGALKYSAYEAAAIHPLIANSPLMSWLD